MCEPTTLAVIAVAAVVIGTGVAVYGQYQAGQAAKAQGDYQEAVGKNNAIQAGYAAKAAGRRGSVKAAQQGLATRRLIAKQRTTLAANNVLVDEGTAAEVVADSAEFGHLEALTIRHDANTEARNFLNQGQNFQAQGELAAMRGSAAESAANLEMAGTAISGFGSVAGQWYTYKTA